MAFVDTHTVFRTEASRLLGLAHLPRRHAMLLASAFVAVVIVGVAGAVLAGIS